MGILASSWACIFMMPFRSSMIILSDGSIVFHTKLILEFNISKNVTSYLSNTKTIIVHMCAFLQNSTTKKQKMLIQTVKVVNNINFTETD